MPHHIMMIAFALLIGALLIYRQVCIAVVETFGPPSAILIIIACYALACLIHRRESGY